MSRINVLEFEKLVAELDETIAKAKQAATRENRDVLADVTELEAERDQLLRDVWGGRVPARSQTLDVHIRWLRQKVEPNPDKPVYIQTVRMIGYRFEGP